MRIDTKTQLSLYLSSVFAISAKLMKTFLCIGPAEKEKSLMFLQISGSYSGYKKSPHFQHSPFFL